MADKRQRFTGRRTSHNFFMKPHHIFKADCKNNIPSPASVLTHKAANMLDNLMAQLNGSNNGDLSAAPKIMRLYGWTSQGSVHDALTELLALGFIEQTRQGGRNKCSLYAVTWYSIDECGGKLDVKPTKAPSNLWKPENADKIDPRFVEAWNKRKQKSQLPKQPKLKSVPGMRTNDAAIRTSHQKPFLKSV